MTYPDLELSGQQFRELLAAMAGRLAGFIDGLEDAPAGGGELPGSLLPALTAPPGEEPGDLDSLLGTVEQAGAAAVETAGPHYFGYIPGGGLTVSAAGELFAETMNRFTSLAGLAPGLVAIEAGVIGWIASLFGLPASAGGLLTTGGSQAVLSMLLAARDTRLGEDFRDGTIYLSDQAHHCVRKAARIAGFPERAIRLVPTSDGLHLDPEAVEAAVAQDRGAGLRPFLLVGTAGTTNTGAVDPLRALADLARRHGLWFHVDGCYGGFFQLTGRGQRRFDGIAEADSISLDPHKSLFLPYGTGALVVRDARTLLGGEGGDYLRDLTGGSSLPDFAHYGTELTRECRGPRLWLPLHLHGVAAFRAALEEKLDLAGYACRSLREEPALEVPYDPELSTVTFRLRNGTDAASQELLAKINASQRAFLSSTRLGGRLTLRLCILSYRTHGRHVEEAVSVIRQAAAGVAG